jgi:diguanylate cyclase (GGDEF)-like protein
MFLTISGDGRRRERGAVSQEAGADVPVPLSALNSVQHALAAVHAAVGLNDTLQAIALGVTTSTLYSEVAVTIAEEPHAAELRCVAVIGSPESQEALLETTCRREQMVEHLAGGEAWGTLRFRSGFEGTEGVATYRPDYEPLDVPDAWQPQFELDAPLYAPDGELIGMLSMDEPRGGRIPPTWVNDVLELFAEQATIAILNARRHEHALRAMEVLEREKAELDAAVAAQSARETYLHRETRRDPLTGLANRVRLQERLEELLAAGISVAVVFCDLDRFKQINDTYGHGVGDEVLRETGWRLAQDLADADVVARIGGDEFVVVAAGVERTQAADLLLRIDQAFAGAPVRTAGLNLQVRSSLGLVCEPGRSQGRIASARRAEELLDSADREMYAHKRSRAGVNRLLKLAEAPTKDAAGRYADAGDSAASAASAGC